MLVRNQLTNTTYSGDIYAPSSFNHYSYCAKDPINHKDIDGHRISPLNGGSGKTIVSKRGNTSNKGSSTGKKSSSSASLDDSSDDPDPERLSPTKNYLPLLSRIKAFGVSLATKAKTLLNEETSLKEIIVTRVTSNASIISSFGKKLSTTAKSFISSASSKLSSSLSSAYNKTKAAIKKAAGFIDGHLSDIASLATKVGTVSLTLSKVIAASPLMATPIGASLAAATGAIGLVSYGIQALSGTAALASAISGKSLDGEVILSTGERLSRGFNGAINLVSGTFGAVASFKACSKAISGLKSTYKIPVNLTKELQMKLENMAKIMLQVQPDLLRIQHQSL